MGRDTRLGDRRRQLGILQRELAEITGISIASLKRLERGLAKTPPLWWYVNCAIALNVTLEEVLEEDAEDQWYATAGAPVPPPNGWWAEEKFYERAQKWNPDELGDW
jgi:transcriptional regulator with XRE-family HTH domain